MTRIERFEYPDQKWKKLWGWKRLRRDGQAEGILIGANPRAWSVGFQWWDCGGCIHLGPLNIGVARLIPDTPTTPPDGEGRHD